MFGEVILRVKRGESKRTNFVGKGILYLTSDYIQGNKIIWDNKKYLETDKDINPYLIEKNDLVINCVNSFARVGKAALFEGYVEPVVIGFNNFAVKVNNNLVDPKYLVYYFSSNRGYKEIIRTIKPAINQVSFSSKDLKIFKIILPPIEEQKKISSILSNLDDILTQTKTIIKHLQILKKGLMQRLFTEGIGHTEFKSTKVGNIPKEWKIIKFQELILKIKRGESKKTNSEGKGVLYLTSDYIQDNKIVWENKKYLETEKDIGPYLLEEDDIIINCVNSFAKVGKVALFRSYYEPVVIGFNNFAVKVNVDLLDPNYLVCYFNSEKGYKEIMRTIKPAINQVSFSSKDVNIFKIILPPLNEQKKISLTFLTIDNKIENEIIYRDKLKEIKKGLMQDLMTGKKRVKIN